MNYKIKRLWRGVASIRDYIVKQAIETKQSITLEVGEDKMTIPYDQLHIGKESTDVFPSKHGTQSYKLIDFPFKADPKTASLF